MGVQIPKYVPKEHESLGKQIKDKMDENGSVTAIVSNVVLYRKIHYQPHSNLPENF